jgi:hypothetical protein
LQGSISDYQIKSMDNSSAIFRQDSTGASELIGLVKGVADLNLQNNAFEFAS